MGVGKAAWLMLGLTCLGTARAGESGPIAIPTFHCMGLYWSPGGGSADKKVLVRYRERGTSAWQEALAMKYNPIPGTDEDLADYRGSVVDLKPGTTYEFHLDLAGTPIRADVTATTWGEAFPVGDVINVAGGNAPLEISESGAPGGYRIYDGRGATIDVGHKHDFCVRINASHVILRNLKLKGAGVPIEKRRTTIGAIMIDGGHDIVIEDCDISDWGRLNPETGFACDYDSAILSRARDLSRLIVQRCKMHDPTFDGSNWYEPVARTHTRGPQCITLFDTGGNHVIRCCEMWSDMEHMYNDIIGGGGNASFLGAPGHDSDVYGNVVSHCWDDGIEVEGGNRNVRVWGNYLTQCLMIIGNAPTSIGPLYVWRNIGGISQRRPNDGGGNLLKMGFAGSVDWMTGHQYVFHNTLFGEAEWLATGGLGGDRVVRHVTSRNNILRVRSPDDFSASDSQHNSDNDFDYDLFNGKVPADQEAHGVRGEPRHAGDAGFDAATKTGRFQLASDSPGAGAGERIPNFNDAGPGRKPDIGAHQRGAPPMRFGVNAGK